MSKTLNYRRHRDHSHLIQWRRPNRSSTQWFICSYANLSAKWRQNERLYTEWPRATDLWSNAIIQSSWFRVNSFILKGVDWIELHWIFFLRELTSSVSISWLVYLCTITSKTLSWNSPHVRRWSCGQWYVHHVCHGSDVRHRTRRSRQGAPTETLWTE